MKYAGSKSDVLTVFRNTRLIIIIIMCKEGIRLDTNGWAKGIHWELCKKFKFDHKNKWYIWNSEPVLENETNQILLNFEIQTDHLFSARR